MLRLKVLGLCNQKLFKYSLNVCLKNQKCFLHKLIRQQNASRNDRHISSYFLLCVPGISFLLGTWQVQRLKWKKNLINVLNERTNSDPIPLPEKLTDIYKHEYQPIQVKGTFLHDKEVFLGPRTLVINGKFSQAGGMSTSNKIGFNIITPFKLSDREETILVNRGWVPTEKRKAYKRTEGQVKGEVELSGLVRLEDSRPLFIKDSNRSYNYHYRHITRMAEELDTSKVYLDAIETFSGGPRGSQTTVNPRNEHMSYIITWYCLSAATSYMWYTRFIKKTVI